MADHGHDHDRLPDSSLPLCATEPSEYNLTAHLIGLFILLVVVIGAVLVPTGFGKYVSEKKRLFYLRSFKLLGVGIILSTAFIHMLSEGTEFLTGGCSYEIFQKYHAWPGALTILGFLLAHGLQVLICCARDVQYVDDEHLDKSHSKSHNHAIDRTTVISLEIGIALHSIVIGLALGTAGNDFIPLLIAICFHQLFEGIALASLIADYANETVLKIAMLGGYVFSTPFGAALGIVLRTVMSENVIASNSMQGILETISAGILIYNGMVNLLQPLFSSKEYHHSSTSRKLLDTLLVWIGCFIMAAIGIWA